MGMGSFKLAKIDENASNIFVKKLQIPREGRSDIENAFSGPPQPPGCPWPCSQNHSLGAFPKPSSEGPLSGWQEAGT